jgi:signal transduction histidine kinase
MGGLVLVTTNQVLREQIVSFAASDIATIRNAYASQGMREAREVVRQLMAGPDGQSFYLLQQDGRVLDGNIPETPARTGQSQITFSSGGRTHQVLGMGAFLAPGLYVFAGTDTTGLRGVQSHIVKVMLVLFAGAMLLAVAGGTLVSWSFLRHTDAMAKACRDIMEGDLKRRLPVRGTSDELDRLAETINEMLSRITALMEHLTQVSNDIAHDLRTPVSHLRHRLERVCTESNTVQDYRAALETAIAKADEILDLFAALLRIAQIEGRARRSAFAPLDLGRLIEYLHQLYEPVADESGHILRLRSTYRQVISGDHKLLIQLFSNLIENALVHTPAGTGISLSLSRDAKFALVQVSDNGPGVPPEEHARLFRRLYRRESSRTKPGHGLGLSLAMAIAELHGGTIRILKGSGLTLEVALPLPPEIDSPSRSYFWTSHQS